MKRQHVSKLVCRNGPPGNPPRKGRRRMRTDHLEGWDEEQQSGDR
jgi:hypothetical protein